jgi:chloramphenicol 3-O-phosphotransferase
MSDNPKVPERIVINAEFSEGGSTINMAIVDFKMEQWLHIGTGLFSIPTIKLTPDEALDLIDDLQHYLKAVTGGDA